MKAINDKDWSEKLTKRTQDYLLKHPDHKQLVDKLLNIDGDFVVIWMGEPHLKELMSRGKVFRNEAILKEMETCNCHSNVASLFTYNKAKIVTGWALSDDGLWRQHSWGLHKKSIIETTTSRELYFGVLLNKEESDKFVYENF